MYLERRHLLPGLCSLIPALLAACSPITGEPIGAVPSALSMLEGFENGSKTSYAAADVTLASGTWTLTDALIGSLSGDVKDGAKAARLRNSGTVTMGFDRTGGAGTVTVKHATYGSDANGSWGL